MEGLSIGRLTVNCAVPRNHPNLHAVRTRLDETAAGPLPAALGAMLQPLERLGDEVILIRKLELTFDLDTSLPPDELARAWAAQLAGGLANWLRPEAQTSFLRFPDQAHYLARFLADSVSGRAAGAWYYKRWQGLAALSLPARLRSALTEEPRRGLVALHTLPPSELTAVLAALGAREARRVLETVAAPGGDELAAAAARVLAPLVTEWLPLAAALASPWLAGLALLARAAGALQPEELPAAARLAAALAAWREAEVRQSAAPPSLLLDLPSQAPLLALTAAARRQLLAPLGGASKTEPAAAPEGWYTRLGGLLLLLPRLAELPLGEVFAGEADRACARLLLLSRAAGSARRAEVLSDPLWRRLCGVAADADLDAWLLAQGELTALTAALGRRALQLTRRLRLVPARWRRPMLCAVCEPGGEWLALAPLTPALRAAVRSADGGAEVTFDVAGARAAARVLAWLAPGESPAEPALTLAAQHVLCAFARRLPGFAGSSPRFLYDSFLDFDATILPSDGTFHCRVGRPRLATLFGLTGALRGRLPIGGGRALELYPGG